jgi:uncharacterized protein YjbI with pentapeptide repeats
MGNQEQLDILNQGVETWNQWRQEHTDIRPDLMRVDLMRVNLSGANLSRAELSEANLKLANLSRANLSRAELIGADLSRANLHGANLSEAILHDTILYETDLSGANLSFATLGGANLKLANLSRANLSRAELIGADLSFANLSGANLSFANLWRTILVMTNLTDATLKECRIYGISAWDVLLDGAEQLNLTITREDQPTITVDNLKIAQFIYLLLNNAEIRDVIDTIAKKVVLILGRFTPERKAILDALREALRRHNYSPILFDFEKPSSRDFTETVRTLAHLSRFIIADLTEPSSIPQELQAIVPDLKVPVQPLLQEAKREYAMFIDFRKYPWVLPIHFYKDQTNLLESLQEKVIRPAEQTAQNYEKQT